jgi:hypothetical protein
MWSRTPKPKQLTNAHKKGGDREMRSKRIQQFGSTALLTGMLSLAAMGPVFADSSISTTGPNSNNTVTNTETTTINVTNNNDLTVTNSNSQTAKSGSASVDGNTTAGSATSGNASNSNSVSTTIAIGNSASVPGLGSGSGSGGGTGSGAGAGSGGVASSSSVSGNGVAKASTIPGVGGGAASVAMLPETGCSVVCDVSALRAAYKPYGGITATALKGANQASAFLTGLAALLSLVAAGGSAYYSTKQRAKA